jgi:hypothetical protein
MKITRQGQNAIDEGVSESDATLRPPKNVFQPPGQDAQTTFVGTKFERSSIER